MLVSVWTAHAYFDMLPRRTIFTHCRKCNTRRLSSVSDLRVTLVRNEVLYSMHTINRSDSISLYVHADSLHCLHVSTARAIAVAPFAEPSSVGASIVALLLLLSERHAGCVHDVAHTIRPKRVKVHCCEKTWRCSQCIVENNLVYRAHCGAHAQSTSDAGHWMLVVLLR